MAELTQDAFATQDGNLSLPPGVAYDGDYRVEGKRRIYDPDHNGDDDSSAEGDTDHSHVLPDGSPGPMAGVKMHQERDRQERAEVVKMYQERRRLEQARPEGGLEIPLLLSGSVPQPLILERPSTENGGVMKIRAPFYVGDSVARAPGIRKPIFFSKDLLPSVIQEGNRQIGDGKQPITIYARHAHAADGEHLPLGAVTKLEQDGRTGYAVMEISPTSAGKDVQVLAENGHLNAVSLRSGAGRFELKDVLVNEQPMYRPSKLLLDGIDFAPDGPAQATYGLEILQEASVTEAPAVIPAPPSKERRTPKVDLTLEALRTESPSLVAEIEAPLRRELATVTQERDALVSEKRVIAREAKLREIAAKFPKPEDALPILLEVCKDCETDEQVMVAIGPILLEALSGRKQAQDDPKVKLLALANGSGHGQRGLGQERVPDLSGETDVAGI